MNGKISIENSTAGEFLLEPIRKVRPAPAGLTNPAACVDLSIHTKHFSCVDLSIHAEHFSDRVLKARRPLIALLAAFLALGLSLLGLSLNSGPVQAAPSGQGGVLQFTLPVTNTSNQTSIYTVTNLTTQTISVRHEFYAGGFPSGQFVAVLTDTYFLFESKIYALNRIPNFPPNFVGDVVITSNQPITGSTRTRAIAIPTPIPPPTGPGAPEPLLPPLPPLRPERVEINWTLVAYLIVGIFALSGFFKGWWKEAITTFFVGILIFFLAVPEAAEWFINRINDAVRFTWEQLSSLGITPPINFFQLDASSGQTWLVILLLFIGLAIFIGRAGLSSVPREGKHYAIYVVTPIGSILGTILGGVNGFLIITLVKHYLEETNLPGSQLPTEIVMTGSNVVTRTSSGPDILITDLPGITWFNFLLPWFVIAFAILVLFMVRREPIIPSNYFTYTYEFKKEKEDGKDKTVILDLLSSATIVIFGGGVVLQATEFTINWLLKRGWLTKKESKI